MVETGKCVLMFIEVLEKGLVCHIILHEKKRDSVSISCVAGRRRHPVSYNISGLGSLSYRKLMCVCWKKKSSFCNLLGTSRLCLCFQRSGRAVPKFSGNLIVGI